MSSQLEEAKLEKNTGFLDGAAIGLSALCAIHCLALPIALTMLPVIATMPLGDESFHKALLFLVIPASAISSVAKVGSLPLTQKAIRKKPAKINNSE